MYVSYSSCTPNCICDSTWFLFYLYISGLHPAASVLDMGIADILKDSCFLGGYLLGRWDRLGFIYCTISFKSKVNMIINHYGLILFSLYLQICTVNLMLLEWVHRPYYDIISMPYQKWYNKYANLYMFISNLLWASANELSNSTPWAPFLVRSRWSVRSWVQDPLDPCIIIY